MVVELYDTERSYVEALQILVNVSVTEFLEEILLRILCYILRITTLRCPRPFIFLRKLFIQISGIISVELLNFGAPA